MAQLLDVGNQADEAGTRAKELSTTTAGRHPNIPRHIFPATQNNASYNSAGYDSTSYNTASYNSGT